MASEYHPIGVFDSGYGGLTVLKELVQQLPNYDFLYLGDNARTPYGTRSFDVVYEYTLHVITSYSIHYTKLYEIVIRPSVAGTFVHSPGIEGVCATRPSPHVV